MAQTIIPVQFNGIQLMQQELIVRGEAPEPGVGAGGVGQEMHQMGTSAGKRVGQAG